LAGGALVLCRAPALAGYFGATNDRSRNTAHFHSRPGRGRAQLTQHRRFRQKCSELSFRRKLMKNLTLCPFFS
jgi:hypothetical protein